MAKTSNMVLSAICGVLFGLGWAIFADGLAYADVNGYDAGPFYLYLPGILASCGLFLMNNLPNEMFAQSGFGFGGDVEWYHKFLLVLSVMLLLASVIESAWVYLGKSEIRVNKYSSWRGISSIVQSVMIAIASFLWRFAWSDNESGF